MKFVTPFFYYHGIAALFLSFNLYPQSGLIEGLLREGKEASSLTWSTMWAVTQ